METKQQMIQPEVIEQGSAHLATVKPQLPQTAQQIHDSPMAMISHAVAAGFTPDHIRALVTLREQMEDRDAHKAFNDALQGFQAECPQIGKNRATTTSSSFAGYHYATYDDIMYQIQPLLNKFGMVVGFNPGPCTDGKVVLNVVLSKGIHTETRGPFECPVPVDMKVNQTQKFGAAMRYAMRYALVAALNIVIADEDCDARSLGNRDEPITPDHALELSRLIVQTKANEMAFFEFATNKREPLPTSVSGLLECDYKRGIHALKAKLAKMGDGK